MLVELLCAALSRALRTLDLRIRVIRQCLSCAGSRLALHSPPRQHAALQQLRWLQQLWCGLHIAPALVIQPSTSTLLIRLY